MYDIRIEQANRLLLLGATCGFAFAQPASEYYRGKQIRMIVGHPVGNDYDSARVSSPST